MSSYDDFFDRVDTLIGGLDPYVKALLLFSGFRTFAGFKNVELTGDILNSISDQVRLLKEKSPVARKLQALRPITSLNAFVLHLPEQSVIKTIHSELLLLSVQDFIKIKPKLYVTARNSNFKRSRQEESDESENESMSEVQIKALEWKVRQSIGKLIKRHLKSQNSPRVYDPKEFDLTILPDGGNKKKRWTLVCPIDGCNALSTIGFDVINKKPRVDTYERHLRHKMNSANDSSEVDAETDSSSNNIGSPETIPSRTNNILTAINAMKNIPATGIARIGSTIDGTHVYNNFETNQLSLSVIVDGAMTFDPKTYEEIDAMGFVMENSVNDQICFGDNAGDNSLYEMTTSCQEAKRHKGNEKSNFHKLIDESSQKNIRGFTGNRYNSTFKSGSMYIWLKGGRGLYNTCARTLSLPSLSTVQRNLIKVIEPTVLGKLGIAECVKFFNSRHLPKRVIVGFDCTALVPKAEYDVSTNTIVGLTPPLDPRTGFPDANFFKATSPSVMLHFLQAYPHARYLEVFMLKPMAHGAPPFTLSTMPTDNRFRKTDMAKQMIAIAEELESSGIVVEGFASDGDEKQLAAEKAITEFGTPVEFHGYLLMGNPQTKYGAAQDFWHLLNKLKMRILDNAIDVYIGKNLVSVSFLQILLDDPQFSKLDHNLTASDVANKDKSREKMSTAGTEKLCSWTVVNCLKSVKGAEGTIQYISMMIMLKQALIDVDTPLKKRLFNMIYIVSFLRRWRNHLKTSSVNASSFITANAWTCVELNLVFFIRLLVSGQGDLMPLCNSQMLEQFFRTIRGFVTWGFTATNFTTLKAFSIISKVKALMNIMHDLKDDINFAERLADQSMLDKANFMPNYLPDEVIDSTINEACAKAMIDARSFGIECSECFTANFLTAGVALEDLLKDDNPIQNSTVNPQWKILKSNIDNTSIVSLRNLHFNDEITEDNTVKRIISLKAPSTYVIISKSQFLNLVDERGTEKLSSDRTYRFIAQKPEKFIDRSLTHKVQINIFISIGDWVVVTDEAETEIVGQIVKFRYVTNSHLRKDRVYKENWLRLDNQKQVEISLEPKYILDIDQLQLIPAYTKEYFLKSSYKCTMDKNLLDLERLILLPEFNDYVTIDTD